jgi:hypothetical protein
MRYVLGSRICCGTQCGAVCCWYHRDEPPRPCESIREADQNLALDVTPLFESV